MFLAFLKRVGAHYSRYVDAAHNPDVTGISVKEYWLAAYETALCDRLFDHWSDRHFDRSKIRARRLSEQGTGAIQGDITCP